MMKKYERPMSRDLSALSFAAGACASGNFVGTCTATAGGLAGDCLGNGTNAGTCTSNGTTVGTTCSYGTFGTDTTCASGNFAAP